MQSAFGVDHGEVSKAFLPKMPRLPKKPKLKSSGETENPFTSKPSRPVGASAPAKAARPPAKRKPTYQTGGFGAGGGNSIPTRDPRYY